MFFRSATNSGYLVGILSLTQKGGVSVENHVKQVIFRVVVHGSAVHAF